MAGESAAADAGDEGAAALADGTWKEPGLRVDLVMRQGLDLFGTEAEVKLEARNLFGRDHEEYQVNSTGLRIENNSYDVGQSFGAALTRAGPRSAGGIGRPVWMMCAAL